jgi:dienelactone hydrolase
VHRGAIARASPLHRAPARCGAEPHTWLDDDALGALVDHEEILTFSPEDIAGVVEGLGEQFVLRRPFERAVSVERVVYTTQDRGALVDASGLIAWPSGAGPFPVLLWAHGTTGFIDRCAPSATAEEYLSQGFLSAFLVAAISSWGYVVVAPDFLGLKGWGEPSTIAHPYLVAEPTALASLDMLTTADALAAAYDVELGPLAVAGASQGGHAAAFIVRYAPHYAPHREIKGAAYLIPPTDFVAHAQAALSADDEQQIQNFTAVLYAFDAWYASDDDGLEGALLKAAADEVRAAVTSACTLPDLTMTAREEIFRPEALAAAEAEGLAGHDPWTCFARENSLVDTSVPRLDDVPALVILGEHDTLVNPIVERAAFTKHCENGMRLWLVECAEQDHAGAVLASVDEIIDFLSARIADEPLPDGMCDAPPIRVCKSDPAYVGD